MLEQSDFIYQDERFADIQLLRYQVPGFKELSLRQKLLIYHLSRAALLGRDILWDQNGTYNLRIRQVLETIYTQYQGDRFSADFQQFTIYLKRVWFSNGIHHHYGYQKFTPGFSQQFFIDAAGQVGVAVDDLLPIIFDATVLSKRVNQAEGDDLLLTSASNYYQDGITQAEAEAFYARQKEKGDSLHPIMYGMNSRLEKRSDGTLHENIWKSGGMYGPYIDRIIAALKDAIPYAENQKQQAVIEKLIEFYQSGNLKTFDEYTILWVQDTESKVDFTNGFTEVYGDPLGLKASWEGYVNFVDPIATRRSQALSDNAQWFEDHSPIDPRFRKKECKGVSAKVINAAILGGDLYPSSAIGINLPNSNWIRAEYGSKSVTIGNLTHAYDEAAKDSGLRQEFVIDEPTLTLLNKYAGICDDLHTDLHECLGHGSGQLLPGVDPDALKAYGSTIEEARADLFGLYYLADEKLVELGLTPNAEAYQAQYYSYLMNGVLTQLVRIEEGHQIEEAHMRNRALIARWTIQHFPEAASLTEKDGKHYIKVHSYPMLRTAFATLLAEIQRIKSEGDLSAARQLVEEFGVKVDAQLHAEVLNRWRALNLSPYKGFINPEYELVYDEQGNVCDVEIRYGEAYDNQMLRYGKLYSNP
ncbi:MAG: dihydrofolate reductase [Bacteroidaceae bacterium]|nr:dihydrofolate reductase [Bacteroidaceae bacterium]